jgi:hypothetical protein
MTRLARFETTVNEDVFGIAFTKRWKIVFPWPFFFSFSSREESQRITLSRPHGNASLEGANNHQHGPH